MGMLGRGFSRLVQLLFIVCCANVSNTQVHLVEIFLKLIDVQRIVCQPVVAMETITRALLSIPVVQLSSCVNSLVSQWVKTKRKLISASDSTGASPCDAQGWVVTKGADSIPMELRKQFVEAELRLCKTR